MKNFLLISISFFAMVHLSAQEKNQVCYHDTALVEQQISKSDTSYMIKSQFCKGDWELFYDFNLTKKRSEYHFDLSGNRTGTWTEWYENGKVKSEWNYTGAWFTAFPTGNYFYPDGKTKIFRAVVNDSLIETSYFTNGKISGIRKWIRNGMMVSQAEWCDNGQLIVSCDPTAAKPRPVKKYHCNGNVKAEYNWYVYGYTGAYTEYYDNGKVSVKGQFQDLPTDANVFMARKIGDWIYYDEKGNVVKTEHWSMGRLMSTDK